MSEWNIVSSNADIAYLLNQYGRFHDSCLVESHFQSGVFVKDKFMYFAEPKQYELRMVFHSQLYPHPLELCFGEVRRFHIAGWQDHYSCELFDCRKSPQVPGEYYQANMFGGQNHHSLPIRSDQNHVLQLNRYAGKGGIAGTLKWRFHDDKLK